MPQNATYTTDCQCCQRGGAIRRRQGTAYVEDELNWVTLCDECHELNEEHWADMWQEYYASRL